MKETELIQLIERADREEFTGLDLSEQRLKALPPEIARLKNLQALDLSYNELAALPPEMAGLTSLQALYLRSNQISSLPAWIDQLKSLELIDLRSNELEALPATFKNLNNLQTLNLSRNQFTNLPNEIVELPRLKTLYINTNNLTSLPPGLFRLPELIRLELSGTRLSTLPPELGQLTSLLYLNLSGTDIDCLPSEISQLIDLRKLELGGTKLTRLPDGLFLLANIHTLDLSGTFIGVIPSRIGQLTELNYLNLRATEITQLPPEIGQLSHLQTLLVSDCKLTSLPEEIGQLTSLKWLDLSNNKLDRLPKGIKKLAELISLDLASNRLEEVPHEIFELDKLSGLNLGKHTTELFELSRLEGLSLSNNRLTSLPPELGRLTQLQSLELYKNQLSSLPAEIGLLTSLKRLDLRDNRLTSLPGEISELTQLTELKLNRNQLADLPLGLGKLPALDEFEVDDNPLADLPPEIVDQGSKAILAFLQELGKGYHQQWTSKLILVGEGGVGKTCLLRALRGEPYTDSPTTRGIEIRQLTLHHPHRSDVEISLNAWDFGGQEIYHATHQFFLTNRSLFLVVWNARHGYEQGKLYYWLDAIQARAPQSPVIIVAAWADERDAELPILDLRRKYPQIVAHFAVSNKTSMGIDELRQAVAQTAISLPLMGEAWPISWLQAASAIRSLTEKSILPEDFHAIMIGNGVLEANCRVLGRWLHELGDILYFEEEQDLNDLVILKPEWVSQYISRVLDSEEIAREQGIFTTRQMNSLWSDLDPIMRDHFLRLMEKFDLSYRTLENREISLVVERLPLDPPAEMPEWEQISTSPACHEIAMKFRLNTIPPGIPTWFIARSHRFTTYTHWRTGALFAQAREKKHLALVQSLPHDNILNLAVRGPMPQNFFALLKDGLEVTLERYPGLKVIRTIPCPGHDGQPCDYEFNYDFLMNALEREKPVQEVQCQKTFEMVSITELLFGLNWRTQDKVLEKLDQMDKAAEDRHNELVTLLQREFLKNYRRAQSQVELNCPNIFTLHPTSASGWRKSLIGEKLVLQLYCQAPGCWHPTGEGGRYQFDYPAGWLRSIAPYLQSMVTVLKFVVPLAGPWLGAVDANYARQVAGDIQTMENLVEKIPELVQSDKIEMVDNLAQGPEPEQASGASLRSVRKLLDKLDEHQYWGGLRCILTPEYHYLWLCDYHAQQYKV